MTVQDLFRILPDTEKVVFNTKCVTGTWWGVAKYIPSNYFDYIVDSIYSLVEDNQSSYIVINLA